MARWGLLSFSGRTRRRVMAVHAILFIAAAFAILVLADEPTGFLTRALGLEKAGDVMIVGWALSWLPFISVCARRLHDIGLSARWLLIWPAAGILVPVAMVVIDEAFGVSSIEVMEPAILGWFFGVFLLPPVLSLLPGRKGSNRFGPDPRLRRGQALEEIFR